jgi:hypothetical protein
MRMKKESIQDGDKNKESAFSIITDIHSVLVRELERENLTEPFKSKKNDIENLLCAWRIINKEVSKAKEFAKLTPLTDERLNLLIGEIKILNRFKVDFENRLLQLESGIDEKLETEFVRAFDFDLEPKNLRVYLPNYLEIIKKIEEEVSKDTKERPEKFPSKHKEKVGLYIATNDVSKFNLIDYTAKEIAREIEYPEAEKVVLATFQDYKKNNSNGSKNIFNDSKLMLKIEEHCTDNNLTITPYFQKKLSDIKTKQGI